MAAITLQQNSAVASGTCPPQYNAAGRRRFYTRSIHLNAVSGRIITKSLNCNRPVTRLNLRPVGTDFFQEYTGRRNAASTGQRHNPGSAGSDSGIRQLDPGHIVTRAIPCQHDISGIGRQRRIQRPDAGRRTTHANGACRRCNCGPQRLQTALNLDYSGLHRNRTVIQPDQPIDILMQTDDAETGVVPLIRRGVREAVARLERSHGIPRRGKRSATKKTIFTRGGVVRVVCGFNPFKRVSAHRHHAVRTEPAGVGDVRRPLRLSMTVNSGPWFRATGHTGGCAVAAGREVKILPGHRIEERSLVPFVHTGNDVLRIQISVRIQGVVSFVGRRPKLKCTIGEFISRTVSLTRVQPVDELCRFVPTDPCRRTISTIAPSVRHVLQRDSQTRSRIGLFNHVPGNLIPSHLVFVAHTSGGIRSTCGVGGIVDGTNLSKFQTEAIAAAPKLLLSTARNQRHVTASRDKDLGMLKQCSGSTGPI